MSKKKNFSFRTVILVCVGLIVAGLIIVGCTTATPTPEVVTVVETVVVEKEVEGETVTIVETVEEWAHQPPNLFAHLFVAIT